METSHIHLPSSIRVYRTCTDMLLCDTFLSVHIFMRHAFEVTTCCLAVILQLDFRKPLLITRLVQYTAVSLELLWLYGGSSSSRSIHFTVNEVNNFIAVVPTTSFRASRNRNFIVDR